MPKVLRIHNSSLDQIQGVDKTALISIKDFNNVSDPLQSGGTLANKPGSSIPSLFARMIFFRMAFANISPIEVPNGQVPPVYNNLVSQCLDLLEEIFSNNGLIQVVVFDPLEQNGKLSIRHSNLAGIIDQQKTKFLSGVGNIFLFLKNQKVIGGTSPFTLVYTSPNWDSGRSVASLRERTLSFREFMYKVEIAYRLAGVVRTGFNDTFFDYVKDCRENDFDSDLKHKMDNIKATYTLNKLFEEYPKYLYEDNGTNRPIYVSESPIIFLHSKNAKSFTSDFFLMPSVQNNIPFDPSTTPLVLTKEVHAGFEYYEGEQWPVSLNIVEKEDPIHPDDITPRLLPGDHVTAKHPYLTSVDFFEQKLLAVPYPINEDKFYRPIKLNDNYSVLLPLKPLCLKYLSMEDIDNNLTVSISSGRLVLEMKVSVCNAQRQFTKKVTLKQTYNLNTDVCYLSTEAMKTSLSIGIFPFYRCTNNNLNKYWVMKSQESVCKYKTNLKFYNYGTSDPIFLNNDSRPIVRDVDLCEFYFLHCSFDYMQIVCDGKDESHSSVKALVVPKFDEPRQEKADQYHYSVDFGTTNTHIAFVSSDGIPHCFGAKEISMQAVYLNKLQVNRGGVLQNITDKLALEKSRKFFPQAKNDDDDSYSFPIRTVVGEKGPVDGSSELFGNVSIGFHFSKELINNSMYQKNLKWDFINSNAIESRIRGRLFFKQILWMIKNHWIMRPDTSVTGVVKYPKLMLTYPVGNKSFDVINEWIKTYEEIFDVDNETAKKNIYDMTESLAPCRRLLEKDANGVNGLLNVDIGGGTTDMQYYRVKAKKSYYFDSILFAGDDLWGMKNENMGEATTEKQNAFTRFAEEALQQSEIKVGSEKPCSLKEIMLEGKEKINFLLRDSNRSFERALTKAQTSDVQTADTRIPRLIIFLHYSAIIYHLTNWIMANPCKEDIGGKEVSTVVIPETINFSGFGSKYIDIMFQDNKILTLFTKALIKKYWPSAVFMPSFKVTFATNPKDVTCQGAALYAKDKTAGRDIPSPLPLRHFGYTTYKSTDSLSYLDAQNKETEVIDYFKFFLKAYQSLDPVKDLSSAPEAANRIPSITDKEIDDLVNWATTSYANIAQKKVDRFSRIKQSVNESLFVWALKDSLWRLGSN